MVKDTIFVFEVSVKSNLSLKSLDVLYIYVWAREKFKVVDMSKVVPALLLKCPYGRKNKGESIEINPASRWNHSFLTDSDGIDIYLLETQ